MFGKASLASSLLQVLTCNDFRLYRLPEGTYIYLVLGINSPITGSYWHQLPSHSQHKGWSIPSHGSGLSWWIKTGWAPMGDFSSLASVHF